ncbi:MAG: galactose mutarotase [Clostridia bacterium]|nr:galactose mutarotase [Clostridia bacterium]
MSITQKEFGTYKDNVVIAYTLDNNRGLKAEILNLGGIIRALIFNGTDVVLGRSDAEAYLSGGYLGALVGRNSNRIEGCTFCLNGKTYTLAANDSGRNNNLHGGICGFASKIWDVQTVDSDEPQLILTTTSPDGEEGFPGNVQVKVTYTLTKDNSLKIHYEGSSDQDTLLNMTNHSYFNLNGHSSGTVKNHTLTLNCSFFTPNTDACVADGRVLSVENTAFDFRGGKKIGTDIDDSDHQIQEFLGYDHNFAIDGRGFRKCACLVGDITGIVMETYTDRPAVQIYTGNYLDALTDFKDNAEYSKHDAICLETQVFPNALKHSHYPSPILKKGEKYDTTTEYKFSMSK